MIAMIWQLSETMPGVFLEHYIFLYQEVDIMTGGQNFCCVGLHLKFQ
jgi:hypothetical protein